MHVLNKSIMALAISATIAGSALAQPVSIKPTQKQEQGTAVRIPATASKEVANDTLALHIYTERDTTSREKAYEEVVKDAEKNLKKVTHAGIKVKNTNFHVFPIYDKNKVRGYRARYSATLESKDFDAMLSLAGKISGEFMVENMSFHISEDLKQATEKDLMGDVVKDIKDKADTLQKALNSSKLDIAEIDFTRSYHPMPMRSPAPRAMMAKGGAEMAVASDMALPAEAGTSRIEVGANAVLLSR